MDVCHDLLSGFCLCVHAHAWGILPRIHTYIFLAAFFFLKGLFYCHSRQRVRERETLHRPQPGIKTASWLGTNPATLWLRDDTPNNWATLAKAGFSLFKLDIVWTSFHVNIYTFTSVLMILFSPSESLDSFSFN